MNVLILGATGATGKLLTEQLLNDGHRVKVIVRSAERLPDAIRNNQHLEIIEAQISEMDVEDLAKHIEGSNAVGCCLGHNLSWKGVYGKPRMLVMEAIQKACNAILINQPDSPTKIVLMNTAGNSNRDLDEPISNGQKFVIGMIRLLLPPHVDNEKAADHLRTEIGKENKHIEWCVVRPDNLIDEDKVTPYKSFQSPITSAIFKPGKTSRINVAHFMAQLAIDEQLWSEWKGEMPVIYNEGSTSMDD